jgi:hypothetical protein
MTNLQFRVLYREFLFRMVDLELLSAHAQGDMSKLFGQFAALLVFLSLGFSIPALGFGGSRLPPPAQLIVTWSAEHFLIATTMLVVGLFAVLTWDSTFPDRRDVLVLAPLPVRARTLFLAKVVAVATALSLAVLILHIAAGFIWPLALHSQATAQTVPALTSDPAMALQDAHCNSFVFSPGNGRRVMALTTRAPALATLVDARRCCLVSGFGGRRRPADPEAD